MDRLPLTCDDNDQDGLLQGARLHALRQERLDNLGGQLRAQRLQEVRG